MWYYNAVPCSYPPNHVLLYGGYISVCNTWPIYYQYTCPWRHGYDHVYHNTYLRWMFVIAAWVTGSNNCIFVHMMTSSNGDIFRVTDPLCGEFTGPGEFPTQRPVTRSFDVFFDLHLNKRLSKQPWGWWFETPLWSLWRHCNDIEVLLPRAKTRWHAKY